jgi:murein L,D-transpeptidase YafK
MDTSTIVILVLIALISLIALWWYFPYFRKPWMPKLRGRAESPEQSLPLSVKNPSLTVYKSRREMRLYDGERPVKRYRIALGINPVDDKRKEGDGCTPEGDFYICTKNDRSKFHLFLGLSYPNEEDAERGLRSQLISQEEYDQIVDALSRQKRPPWNTRLGGEIGIHGEGTDVDWTQGCVAMSNADIEELFAIMDLGSPVKILP